MKASSVFSLEKILGCTLDFLDYKLEGQMKFERVHIICNVTALSFKIFAYLSFQINDYPRK